MKGTIAERIMREHLTAGELAPGEEIGLKIDQTLTQDATGTMVYLEFESLGLDEVKPERVVSYIDHNILQHDHKNVDDHRFLRSCAARYGTVLSPAGNGVSHHVHRQRWGIPGQTLLGSDSHTTTGGCLGMLAMGAGGLEVALAMAGMPYYMQTPEVWGICVEGRFRPWVSGKDLILELAWRFTVNGGIGTILEFYGPGVANIDMSSRAAIANMSVDIGAIGCIFPSDEVTRLELERNGRAEEWAPISAEGDAEYEHITEVNLDWLEPLVACPGSPDNVVPARELAHIPVHQVLLGSSGNGDFRDIMVASKAIAGQVKHPDVDFEINPASRQDLQNVILAGGLQPLIDAGARINQAGCLGCFGIGQAPGTGTNSLRTFPLNVKGRSGTKDDNVYLCSPEVAVASAMNGYITDPRKLGDAPSIEFPHDYRHNRKWFILPPSKNERRNTGIVKGPNVGDFPRFDGIADEIEGTVLLKVGDDISTDTIMPGGARVLQFRSNIPQLSRFAFESEDPDFHRRALAVSRGGESDVAILGGENYGQGARSEHAAIALRYLGVRVKIAKSFARFHKTNLLNYGVLPLTFADARDHDFYGPGTTIHIENVRAMLESGERECTVELDGEPVRAYLDATARQRRMLLAGGALNLVGAEVGS